jgi:NAD(P)-dependent dehydrogenase (short-subunit alcohol dehydrogenase family)
MIRGLAMNMDFVDKVAIVTGGTSGVGRAVVRLLLQRGARVAAIARRTDNETAGQIADGLSVERKKLLILRCDISEEEQVARCFDETVEHFGKIDVVFANAAICHAEKSTMETSLSEWNETIGINLTGTFLTCKHALRHMVPRQYGKIVLTDSSWTFAAEPGFASYVATKGGVWSMGRNLALEVAHHNINVNIVCPGNIDTPQLRAAIDLGEGSVDQAIKKRFGQVSSATEVAEVMLFLASDRASALNGAHIVVDHGASLRDGQGIIPASANQGG